MVDAARQMLDELMGRNRNLHPSEAGHKVNWEDPGFCQFYNVKFCPHDLFINTRADLGPCSRIHDDEAKHLYVEAKPTQRKRQYEDEFLRFCNVMLHDVDRKILKGKQRLQLMQNDQPTAHVPAAVAKYLDQLNNLNGRISKLLAEAEEAGIRGDVDQAQDLMTICDELKDEKDMLQKQYDDVKKNSHRGITGATSADPCGNATGNHMENDEQSSNMSNDGLHTTSSNASLVEGNNESNEAYDTNLLDDNDRRTQAAWTLEMNSVPEKQMKVCEICGAFLIVGDAQQRIEDHLMGKQHLGYSKLRNAVAEINERRQREREMDERRRREERSQRGNTFDFRRDQRDYRDRSRDYGGGGGGSGGSSSSSGNRHQSDKHRYHHKSHHRSSHSHSRNSRSSGGSSSRHQNYYIQSHERSRSRSRY